jgi:sugar phosphate permease
MNQVNLSDDPKTIHAKPSSKYRWGIMYILLLGAIVNYLDRSNLSIANPIIAKEFNLGPAAMGVLLSAFLWPYAIANLPAGWLVDRIGPKRAFGWAAILWSVVTICSGFARNYSIFYFFRTLLGVAEAPFWPAGLKVAQNWFGEKERGVAVSIYSIGPSTASAIAPPILTYLMLGLGWRGMFFAIGIFGIFVAGLWMIVYKDPRAHQMNILEETMATGAKSESDTKISWGSLFKHKSTWAMIFGNFGILYTFYVYLTWLPGYLVTARHMSILKTGWVASIPFFMGIIGVLIGGWISDFFIRRGYNPITARKIPIVGAAILAAVSVGPVAYVDSVTVCIILLSIGFFASALPSGVIWTLAADVAPANQVASLGAIQNFGGYLGASIAPIITGIIIQSTGSYNLVFVVGAVLCAVAAISYGLFLKKPIKEA